MRYPDGGGLTAAERARREQVRLAAAVPGDADVGESVAAGAGRRRPDRADVQRPWWGPVQADGGAGAGAGGGAGSRPGRAGLGGSVLDAGKDRRGGAPPVRRGLHLGGAGPAVAPDRVECAGSRPPGRRAGRSQDCRLEGGDLARHKRTAADLGAWLVFEDESGQGLRPPKGRTWGRRGHTPVVKVTGGSN